MSIQSLHDLARPGAVVSALPGDAAQAVVPAVQTHAPTLDSVDVIRERLEIGLNALVEAGGSLIHRSRRQSAPR